MGDNPYDYGSPALRTQSLSSSTPGRTVNGFNVTLKPIIECATITVRGACWTS